MKFSITVLFSLIFLNATSQITFEKILGGENFQSGYSITTSADGGFVIAGVTTTISDQFLDIAIVKVDSLGDSLWTKTYGGPGGNDFPSQIVRTYDGGYLISATTYALSTQPLVNSDWWLLRTDANGDTLWTKKIRKSGNDRTWHVSETSDHSILVCGWWSVSGYARGTLVKFSETGDSLWSVQMGSAANSYAQYCMENTDGNYLVCGAIFSGTFQASVFEVDTAGVILNTHQYDRPGTVENINALHPLPQGGYIFSAKTGSANAYNLWLVRLNDQWDTVWTQVVDSVIEINDIETEFGFDVTNDGGCVVAGTLNMLVGMKASLHRYDSSGARMWDTYFGIDTLFSKASSVIYLADGGFIFTGQTDLYTNFSAQVYIVRTDGDGIVGGINSLSNRFENNFCTIYPNPVRDLLYWKLQKEMSCKKLKLFSSDGKLIREENPFSETGNIAVTGLPAGLYWMEFTTEGFTFRKKVIVNF